MRILHVIKSMDPAAGGPVEGIKQLILTNTESTVEIVCLDSPDAPWLPAYAQKGIIIYALGPALFNYGYNSRLVPWLRVNHTNFDTVIVNGIWQFHSFAAWMAFRNSSINYHVFVHGMLDPWFKKTFPLKHLKKWLYWPWGEYRVLRDAKTVIFTCEEEKILARKSFWLYKANEQVVRYGIPFPDEPEVPSKEAFLEKFPLLKGKRFILFMGRINRKKGCDILIRAFSYAAKEDPDLLLVIAGPDQNRWQSVLNALARNLGLGNRVIWTGMLTGKMKWGAFYLAEAFCLPSHQENFGIVVAEALACGLPVLISDKVNIWREIKAGGAGLVEADTMEGCKKMLLDWIKMDPSEKQNMKDCAKSCFEKNFHIASTLDDLMGILES